MSHQVNLPRFVGGVDVIVDRLDPNSLGLVPVVSGPPEPAWVDGNPFWMRVGDVDNNDAFRLQFFRRADNWFLERVVHFLHKAVVELDCA